jgi:L-seryl-tRNA(Ser) seleniumtransferase
MSVSPGFMTDDPRASLPSVDRLAGLAPDSVSDRLATHYARRLIAGARDELASQTSPEAPDWQARMASLIQSRSPLATVVNATGVVLHTNLGRAPTVADSSFGGGYVNLELDLATGSRGSRYAWIEDALCALTGAEAAMVVNNNAAAVLLAVSAVVGGGEVVVSRGELVEIGGSFRIPEVVAQGGAVLREVGTTNRTTVADYAAAISDATGALLQVHPSNYSIEGFTARPDLGELAALAQSCGVPLVCDIGSGLLDAHCGWLEHAPAWLEGEPGARQTLEAGADLVTFSADKLLGGPQAGIICGRSEQVDRMRTHPLSRAVRYDKVRAARLQMLLASYLEGTAHQLPLWRCLVPDSGHLKERCEAIVRAVAETVAAEARPSVGVAGGGSTPGATIDSYAVEVADPSAHDVVELLRRSPTPVIARVEEGRALIDLLAVDPAHDAAIVEALRQIGTGSH